MKKFFVPFVEPQHEEAVYARIAKSAGAEIPERRLRALYYTEDDKSVSATVGKAFRKGDQIVTAILPTGGGYVICLSPADAVRKGVVRVGQDAVLSVKHFDAPPGTQLQSALADAEVAKRLTARRQLFSKVQTLADAESIPWEDALRKILLDPANLELLASAQEPKRPRASRQRLSDEELDARIRQLDGLGTDPDAIRKNGTEPEVTPVRRRDGTIDETATAIKKIHARGGTVARERK